MEEIRASVCQKSLQQLKDEVKDLELESRQVNFQAYSETFCAHQSRSVEIYASEYSTKSSTENGPLKYNGSIIRSIRS